MINILVIEDDEKLRLLIKECLEKYNYKVTCIEDFKDIEALVEKENPNLVLLDVNLPYYDGFYLCRVLRRKSNIPIIMISARNSEFEQVMGIELGADDYIIKPFSIDLLLAKVKSALRRVYGEYAAESKGMEISGISLDEGSFKIHYKGQTSELSKNEFKLIKKLLENSDKIVSREDLLSELWDDSAFVDDNTLTVNVTRVKSKLSELGVDNVIKTKRGSGYMFDATCIGNTIEN
jgi:DNA-binding response OmpR family regulator